MQPIMLVAGTRPEGIKIIPVYFALKQAGLPVLLCATSQHEKLLSEVFACFNVTPDIDLNIMVAGQDLAHITNTVLSGITKVINQYKPQLILVQGDTTTTMATAMAAFYNHIPIGHIEAGLRTGDINGPYPEEFNRLTVGLIASYHFAPTALATGNLLAEGKKRETIYCVGNTVVDALRIVQEKIKNNEIKIDPYIESFFEKVKQNCNRSLLFTMHRRESFGTEMVGILETLKQFALHNPDVSILYPYHPNPAVIEALEKVNLKEVATITLIPPLLYTDLIYVLLHADAIATDSGGIQEEGVSLGKKIIVMREKSERMEGVWEGLVHLVGTNKNAFLYALNEALSTITQHQIPTNIYGDGFAADRIAHIIKNNYVVKTQRQSAFISHIRQTL